MRTEEGKLHLFVAIDRTSKFAFAELHEKATRRVAGDFLRRLIAAVPYRVHTVLTDNGTHFTDPGSRGTAVPEIRAALEAGESSAPTASSSPAPRPASSTGSQSRTILGRTVRSSA